MYEKRPYMLFLLKRSGRWQYFNRYKTEVGARQGAVHSIPRLNKEFPNDFTYTYKVVCSWPERMESIFKVEEVGDD